MAFKSQDTRADFRKLQEEIIKFWKENNIFEKSIENRPTDKPYRFYDGPPFITGMPHYGTLLSSIAKDVIPRYQTMKGKRVDRTWGRDCHGIYIEQKVQKELNIQTKDIESKIGIEGFINECYKYTKANSAEWERYINNIGRRVDMYNAYETQDNDYMESVLRVFKQLREKGYIYEGKRVSMYSTKLSTPISSFEVAMDDTYEDVNDPAITVAYDLSVNGKDWDNIYLLIWTTTPWTIPANMAAGVHKEIDYVKIKHKDKIYICARNRADAVFKHIDDSEYSIIDDIKGSELVGLSYKPPYDYYYGKTGNDKDHKIYHADFTTDESGTGCVHEAPEFGEVDFELAQKEGITISGAMDKDGNYTNEITDKKGIFYRDANDTILQELSEKGVLFHKASITHRVAFCPRSGVPLVYKAQNSRFINIQNIKEKLLAKNEEINRFPSHLKYGRFAKSLESAPDRCISRTRYRGSPMPVRRSEPNEKGKVETLVIGSREEMFQYNKDFKKLTKIIFVRHGRTDYNEKSLGDPEGKARLTELGKGQATKISAIYADHHIDVIYSSPLQRCIDTITPLAEAKGIEIIKDDTITDHKNPSIQDKEFHCHLLKRNDEPIGGEGESVKDIYKRSEKFIKDIIAKHPGETVVICSHQEPIVMMRKALEAFDYDKYRQKFLLKNEELGQNTTIEYILVDGAKLFDLHKPRVDSIQLKSPTTGATLTRISEVLDPWMESASMPYAQVHYPFENKEKFDSSFPADYVVEYTGQIRARFYVMHVIGVALFDKPPYTNVICTGVLQGDDGRKMSKSYGNYPDPRESFKKYGGDAIRMSLLDSPVVYGGDVAVSESAFLESTKTFLLPLRNAFYFFVTYANIDGRTPENEITKRENFLDKRIVSEFNQTIKEVDIQLAQYNMQKAVQPIKEFLDNLTNRYIRRSRRRFWKSENDRDKQQAYVTLHYVLLKFSQICAPLMPFISEYIYKVLEQTDGSIHLTDFPKVEEQAIDSDLSIAMKKVQTIVSLGLSRRAKKKIRVRQPLQSITIGSKLDEHFNEIIRDELNIKEIIIDESINDKVNKICKPNARLIGPKYGKDVQQIIKLGKEGKFEEIKDNGTITVKIDHRILQEGEFEFDYIQTDETLDVQAADAMVIAMDPEITPELKAEGFVRDLVRSIQEARKEADYKIEDRIKLSINSGSLKLEEKFGDYIQEETLSTLQTNLDSPDLEKTVELGGKQIFFGIKR